MTTKLNTTHRAYDSLVADTVDNVITLGINKGGEYAGDNNRLENFVRNAQSLNLEPEQVWAVYAGKHWDAIIQYVNDTASGKSRTRSEPITGRVDDLIVYLLLVKSMMIARTCVDNNFDITVTEKEEKWQMVDYPASPTPVLTTAGPNDAFPPDVQDKIVSDVKDELHKFRDKETDHRIVDDMKHKRNPK